jgi:hypothetical protein
MVQDIPWKADSHLACQTIACFLYGTLRFITLFTKACHRTLFWVSQIQFAPSIPVSLRPILMLSSHLCLGLPSGLFPSGLQAKTFCYTSEHARGSKGNTSRGKSGPQATFWNMMTQDPSQLCYYLHIMERVCLPLQRSTDQIAEYSSL